MLSTTSRNYKKAWDSRNNHGFQLEFLAGRSFDDEMLRALSADFALLPVVFLLMSVLCIGIYARRDPVFSRAWLGFGAVITVLLAIIASFGLLFIIGVPFTNLTPVSLNWAACYTRSGSSSDLLLS